MSRPRYDWWAYVKGMIRRYPSLCAEEKALHDISISHDLSGLPHGTGKHSDSVANAAMRNSMVGQWKRSVADDKNGFLG